MFIRLVLRVAVPLLLCLLFGCGAGLQVKRLSVASVVHDAPTKSTKVTLAFEVWDDDQQLLGLPREAFTIYEDGQLASSESLAESDTSQIKIPVVLVLDTSLSMYQADAIASLKDAARKFVGELEGGGFEVHVIRFASKVALAASVDAIADEFSDPSDRWTSLYAALNLAFTSYPRAMVVAFSDGADNYSQNHGVAGLSAIEGHVLPDGVGTSNGQRRVVHTVAFGNAHTEQDRQGIAATQALRRLARNGSYHEAADQQALSTVFSDLAARIREIYLLSYLSPNLSGVHRLQLRVEANGKSTQSEVVTYNATGATAPVAAAAAPATAGASTQCIDSMRAVAERWQGDLKVAAEGCQRGEVKQCTAAGDQLSHAELPQLAGCDGQQLAEMNRMLGEMSAAGSQQFYKLGCPPPGIGTVLRVQAEGLEVMDLLPNSAAQDAGLVVGDIVVAVDGKPLAGVPLAQAIELIKGEADSTVVLTAKHADGTQSDKPVTRRAREQDPAACERLGTKPGAR